MGQFVPKELIEPNIQRALGGMAGTTIVFGTGGSAIDLTAGGSVLTPLFIHLRVKENGAMFIANRVGTTYSGSTPAGYPVGTWTVPVKDQLWGHWAAETSGSTAIVSGTVFGLREIKR